MTAVLRLGFARARRRAAATLLTSTAIAAGIALTLALTGLQATAADLAIRQQLAADADEPAAYDGRSARIPRAGRGGRGATEDDRVGSHRSHRPGRGGARLP